MGFTFLLLISSGWQAGLETSRVTPEAHTRFVGRVPQLATPDRTIEKLFPPGIEHGTSHLKPQRSPLRQEGRH
ncbi:jg21844 [Pararge aegeria aegeria]|uniref:Jg21844 protein n=1 Tax=Pararge aegeria aegeria TaxID=348720 RepID=A0A8S4QNH7_9NEOP|nr:jg21844 [Pararge aegeria aegeria]